MFVLADIVSLDTPIPAVPIEAAPPLPPPRPKPLPAKTERIVLPVAPVSATAATVGSESIEAALAHILPPTVAPSILDVAPPVAAPFFLSGGPGALPDAGPPSDAAGFTAPMSAPPRSAVTPVPHIAERTVAAPDLAGVAAPVQRAEPPTALSVPDAEIAPPTRPSFAAPAASPPKPQADPLRARFETIDRFTRPLRVWIAFGLCAAVTLAETFDSAIGSFPIFRTLFASIAWLVAFALLAARVAGAEDDGVWTFDGAIAELRASAESAISEVRTFSASSATHRKRVVGRGLFILGLLTFALWSTVDVTRLVFSEILHIAVRAKPDIAGHATLFPFGILLIGAALLFLVQREERSGQLAASKETLAQALPLHATPLTSKQLIEQARLFPADYHPVLAVLATSTPPVLVTERMTAESIAENVRRSLNGVGAACDVASPGHELSSRRVHLIVGGGLLVDVTFVRDEADVERAAKRAAALVDEKRAGLVIALAIAKGPAELRDLLTPKIAELRQRAPVIGLWLG